MYAAAHGPPATVGGPPHIPRPWRVTAASQAASILRSATAFMQ